MRSSWILVGLISFSLLLCNGEARKAACHDPIYPDCYGSLHKCPATCSTYCEVDCRLCKPICACDKPGAICQDPRFIGGDGILFYFHGRKDEQFCIVTDLELHINAHFIGKKSKKGRDFTWIQSIGILFGPHQFYFGAKNVSNWQESIDHMIIRLNQEDIMVPTSKGETWQSKDAGLRITRLAATNAFEIKRDGFFTIIARVVPITAEESRIHGYGATEENCFAHLELNFKFDSLSKIVDGVLGQTYRPSYQSRLKMTVAMPVMGGAEKYRVSHVFATDCGVSKFGGKNERILSIKPGNAIF